MFYASRNNRLHGRAYRTGIGYSSASTSFGASADNDGRLFEIASPSESDLQCQLHVARALRVGDGAESLLAEVDIGREKVWVIE